MPSDVEEKACKYPIERKLHVDNLMRKIREFYQSRIESSDLRNPISYTAPKSIEDAKRFRQKAMALVKEGKLYDAHHSLNRSLASAPLNSAELSLGYAARSSNSFSQGFYGCCLLDIEQAMTGKLSEDLKKQLRKRRKNAREKLNKEPKSPSDRVSFLLESKINDRLLKYSSEPPILDHIKLENDRLPNTRSLVKFRYEKDASSYLVAENDIPAGAIISAERSYSRTLNREVKIRFMHCAFCFLWSPFLIPCTSCSEVMYCNVRCRQNAYDAYHRTECKMINFCFQVETDETIQQALQLLFVGTKQGKRLSKLMKTMPLYVMMIEEFRPPPELRFTSDYLTFLNTIRNRRLWDEETRFQRTMTVPLAVNTVIALRNVSFFDEKDTSPNDLTKKEMFVALLLVDHLVLLKSLDSDILSQVDSKDEWNNLAMGKAFFPIQNLIGRSCYPNCQSFVDHNYRFLFTTRCIKAGEMISFAERSSYLVGSWTEITDDFMANRFSCKCEACLRKWPSIFDLKASKPVFHDKKHKDTLTFLLERTLNCIEKKQHFAVSPREAEKAHSDVSKERAFICLETTAELITHLCYCQFLQNPSYELIILETILLKFMKSFYSDFYWHDLDFKETFYEAMQLVLSRIESAEVNQSGEEDSTKCEVVVTLFNKDKTKVKNPLTYQKYEVKSDKAEENDATTTKLRKVLNEEANYIDVKNCVNRNVLEFESHTDKKANNFLSEIQNTAVLSDGNPSNTGEENLVTVCPIKHSVKENRLLVKTIGEIKYPQKRPTTEKKSCKENIGSVPNENIDLISPQGEIDEKVFSEGANGTIEKEPIIGCEITRNTNADVEAKLNEAASSSRDGKIDERTLEETKLLALIDDVYQVQLEFSKIFDRCYSDSKSKEVSSQFRTLAKRGRNKENASDLSASIAFAPNNSEELALAYAGRSTILRNMGQVDSSLVDLNRAIAALGKCNKSKMKMLQIRKQKYLRNINKDRLNSNCDANDSYEVKNYNRFPRKSPENFLSPKLKILENNTIVAIQLVKPGEELMRERLMVKAVEKDKRYSRCSHCLLACNALIPCSFCTRLMFCSEECLNEAYESYHRSECQMVKFFDRDRMEVDIREIIALRAFFIGTNQGKDIPKLLAHFKRLYGTQEEDVDSGKLTCVGDFLVALKNDESLMTRLEEVLPSAVEMVIALRSFPFFSEKYSKPPPRLSEEEILSTLLLAMNLISMGWESKFNIMAQIDSENLDGEESIGCGIYVEQNLVRNSCYPNTISVYRQGCRYLYSSRVIEKGEQVTYSQICDLKYFTLNERRSNLAQEGLVCNCDACLENWPSKRDFVLQEMKFKGNHSEESLILFMRKIQEKYSMDFSPDELCQMITNCIFALCICVKQPCPQIVDFEEILTNVLRSSKSEFHFECYSRIRKKFFSRVNELLEYLDPHYEISNLFGPV